MERDKLTTLTNIFTIVGVIVAVGVLVFALNAIEQSQTLLNETRNLVNQSNAQLEILNDAVTEIAHQTIMEAYNQGGLYQVDMKCVYSEESQDFVFRARILDEKGKPSVLKFFVITTTYFYSVDKDDNRHYYYSVPTVPTEFQNYYGPGISKNWTIGLNEFFNWADEFDDSNIYVRSTYKFAPHSDAKDKIISDFISDETGHLLLGFTKNGTGNWVKIESNPNIVCN